MKQLFTLFVLCWLCGSIPLYAQTPPPDSLRQHLDNLFAPIDKAQIPAPFLEEYGLRFLPLDIFKGTLTDSSLTNIQAFRLAYASVFTGCVASSNALPTLSDLNTRLRTQVAASSAIPIMVQRIDYAAIRPDALTAGLLRNQNNQLYDMAGRSQSPYLQRVLFMASPARNVSPTGDVSFVFAQNLHVQSGGGSLSSMNIDFGDGRGYLPATWGQAIGANYCTAGTKRVKVRVIYSASGQYTILESHFDLEVRAPGCAPAARYADPGREVVFGPTAQHSGGKVFIRYGDANRTRLLRPLIVAEGYDVSSIAPDLQSNYSIQNFLDNISNPSFDLYSSLESAARPNGLPNGAIGYDIVFIDYANGTDDIRRNAALFREVVDWVNTEKANNGSTEANVVMGISMGGLVARFGLAQMERAVPNSSQTRLLITHDSPHRGANTPLGLQALTRQANAMLAAQIVGGINILFGTDIFPELFEAEALLDAPATKQLLLVRATRSGIGPFSSFGASYNTFINNDYQPVVSGTFPYQFVATSLGSQCGNASLNPYDELVRYNFSAFFSPNPLIRRTSYKTEIVVNAMPNAGRVERISSLRIFRQVRTLGVFNSRTYFTNFAFNSPANNPMAWDGLPGGTQNIADQARINPPTPNYSLLWFLSIESGFYRAGDFCFIPTASALDVPLDNLTTRSSYVSDLSSSPVRPVPVHFIAQNRYNAVSGGQKFNYPHPFFPARQAQWIFNEMQLQSNAVVACTSECNPYPVVSITGANAICANGSAVYSVVPPFGGVTSWSVSPTNLATITTTPTTGATSITLAGVGANGVVTLTAQISNGCYGTTATRQVDIGSSLRVSQYAVAGCGIGVEAKVVGTDKVVWVVNGQEQTALSVADGSREFFEYVNGKVTVALRGLNPCTGASFTSNSVTKTRPTTGTQCLERHAPSIAPTATLYPNPARETVDVHVENASSTAPVTVRLFDAQGQLRAEKTSNGAETVRLKTDHLPAGLYFVHILRGKQVFSRQQVQIEK